MTHAQFPGIRRQLVDDSAVAGVILALVGHEIVQPHAAVLADQAERDDPLLQHSDRVWPGDFEQVGGLLSRPLSPDGKDGHSMAWAISARMAFRRRAADKGSVTSSAIPPAKYVSTTVWPSTNAVLEASPILRGKGQSPADQRERTPAMPECS
jgi:hypothetical protein